MTPSTKLVPVFSPVMNIQANRSAFLIVAVLALASGLPHPAAVAGPGPDYWRNPGQVERVRVATPAEPNTRLCTDARRVAVTETSREWSNGRGPLLAREVGTIIECTACDTPMVVMKPSGHNSRGPMMPLEIKGRHDCVTSGCGNAAARVN